MKTTLFKIMILSLGLSGICGAAEPVGDMAFEQKFDFNKARQFTEKYGYDIAFCTGMVDGVVGASLSHYTMASIMAYKNIPSAWEKGSVLNFIWNQIKAGLAAFCGVGCGRVIRGCLPF